MPTFFQTISTFFSSANPREGPPSSGPSSSRRGQQPQFSLPTHSPIIGGAESTNQDVDSPHSNPQGSTSSGATFSYPPTRSDYDYDYPMSTGPQARTNRINSTSPILPLHGQQGDASQGNPLGSYPPLHHTWNRLRAWLDHEYTELGDTLNWGVLPEVVTSVQGEIGLPLPSAVRDSYLICDGQELESAAGCADGLFFGLTLLPLEDVLEEWRFWREVDEDPATGANERLRSVMKSIPAGYVRNEYSCKGWLPLVTDRAGNYLGVDLSPGDGGTFGQVIVFGRDFDTKVVMWRGEGEGGWGRWLAGVVDELENGEGYELGNEGGGSSGSEDEVGYESYFYSPNGVTREGGEGHTGGLRLTGEYKGWNVLEAWADRSVKRWIQAGLYKEPEHPDAIPKTDAEMADSTLVSDSHPATEVPIPVLGGQGLTVKTSASDRDVTDVSPTTPRARAPPPAIAIVPPIPMPVPIPTASDLLTNDSPESSQPVSPNTPYTEPEPAPVQERLQPTPKPTVHQSRMASEDSMDGSESGVMLALTGRHSVETSSGEGETDGEESSPMTEANLVAPAIANEQKKISPAPSLKELQKPNGAKPPALQTSGSSSTVGQDESLDLRTPTATSFANGIAGDKPVTPEPAPAVVETPASAPALVETASVAAIEPPSSPTIATSPASTRVSFPSTGDERPVTPSSPKGSPSHHKKHSLSISKLFHHNATGSGSGSEDESAKANSTHGSSNSKRSSMFGSGFRLKGAGSKKKGSGDSGAV